jgi:hypothetical protein
MSSFEIKIKSIDINYMNSVYVSNYSVKSYTDVDNVDRVSIWFVTKKLLVDVRISMVATGKTASFSGYTEFFKGSVDYCKLSGSFLGQAILLHSKQLVEKYGNMTLVCPVPIESAYINFPVSAVKLPPFIPIANSDFIVKVYIKMKLPGKRPVRICDFVVAASMKVDQSDSTNNTKL